MHTLTRKSVPLPDDVIEVAHAIQAGSPVERSAVEALTGPLPARVSESQAISRLVALGAAQVRLATIEAGYAAYAASLNDEDRAYADAQRTRRARLTD